MQKKITSFLAILKTITSVFPGFPIKTNKYTHHTLRVHTDSLEEISTAGWLLCITRCQTHKMFYFECVNKLTYQSRFFLGSSNFRSLPYHSILCPHAPLYIISQNHFMPFILILFLVSGNLHSLHPCGVYFSQAGTGWSL